MSVTKSFVGTVAEILIADGVLDDTKRVSEYVPELGRSAFGSATVRQVMDMTAALDYNENYADPESDIWQYAAAGDPTPKPASYTGPRNFMSSCRASSRRALMARLSFTNRLIPTHWPG